MYKPNSSHLGFAALIALTAIVLTAGIVLAASWVPPVNISLTQVIQDYDRVDIVAAQNDIAVIWANSQAGAGVTIARKQGENGAWEKINPGTTVIGQLVWAPTIAHSGTEIAAVWAEGSTKGGCTQHAVVTYRIAGTTKSKQTVKTNLYGPSTTPHIAVNASGWHLVFAGSESEADCRQSRHGLYYSFRAAGSATWSAPTQIITHNTAVPTALQGGVSHPRVATIPGSSTVHIVWEQYGKYEGPSETTFDETSIWHTSGVAPSSFAASLVRLSPNTQQYPVRPSISVGGSSKVHVTWTQPIGNRTSPSEQHIWYRTVQAETLTRLNQDLGSIYVNSNFPTFAGTSLVAQGSTVCAAWYGYYGSVGAGREEVTVMCSQTAGATWQTAINVSESDAWLSIFPAVSIDPAGLLHFAWAEYDLVNNAYKPVAVFYRNSEESSTVFLPLVMRRR